MSWYTFDKGLKLRVLTRRYVRVPCKFSIRKAGRLKHPIPVGFRGDAAIVQQGNVSRRLQNYEFSRRADLWNGFLQMNDYN